MDFLSFIGGGGSVTVAVLAVLHLTRKLWVQAYFDAYSARRATNRADRDDFAGRGGTLDRARLTAQAEQDARTIADGRLFLLHEKHAAYGRVLTDIRNAFLNLKATDPSDPSAGLLLASTITEISKWKIELRSAGNPALVILNDLERKLESALKRGRSPADRFRDATIQFESAQNELLDLSTAERIQERNEL